MKNSAMRELSDLTSMEKYTQPHLMEQILHFHYLTKQDSCICIGKMELIKILDFYLRSFYNILNNSKNCINLDIFGENIPHVAMEVPTLLSSDRNLQRARLKRKTKKIYK
jgi:hypothetical protein